MGSLASSAWAIAPTACSDRRSFLKLFPDRKGELEDYIAERSLLFSDVEQVITLLKYTLNITD